MNVQRFLLDDTVYFRFESVLYCGIITDWQPTCEDSYMYKLTVENTRTFILNHEDLTAIDLDILVNL